jgi:hypothetical protein
MATSKKTSHILWYQAFGFLLIIALSWMDEFLHLPRRLFGGVQHSDWHEALMESFVAIAVWLVLFLTTKQILARLYYYQEFIRMCAWCRKIDDGDKWVPLEEYLSKGFDTETSHAICPECQKTHFPNDA